MNSYTLSLPLRVQTTKTKWFVLNLNQYRNAHYFTLNNAKKEFKRLIQGSLRELKDYPHPILQIELKYTVYAKTKRQFDIANVCSVIDKFFCDAFVEHGLIEDDSVNYLTKVTYEYGGIDKENPRCDVNILIN